MTLNLVNKGYLLNEVDKNDRSRRILKRKLLNITPLGLDTVRACNKALGIEEPETETATEGETTHEQ